MVNNHYRVRMVLDNMPVTTLDLEMVRPSLLVQKSHCT
jgi:hypothetical protein